MDRRTVLKSGATVVALGIAGCIGGSTPEAANEFGYPTIERDGVDVPLAPTDAVYEWYTELDSILIVDTRVQEQYQEVRITGAELSPAPNGLGNGDPIQAVDPETRIVTYCVCPHTLSTLRGASAIKDGFTHVYALDQGLQDWIEKGYPIEGTEADQFTP